jgi:hypothetical protein
MNLAEKSIRIEKACKAVLPHVEFLNGNRVKANKKAIEACEKACAELDLDPDWIMHILTRGAYKKKARIVRKPIPKNVTQKSNTMYKDLTTKKKQPELEFTHTLLNDEWYEADSSPEDFDVVVKIAPGIYAARDKNVSRVWGVFKGETYLNKAASRAREALAKKRAKSED